MLLTTIMPLISTQYCELFKSFKCWIKKSCGTKSDFPLLILFVFEPVLPLYQKGRSYPIKFFLLRRAGMAQHIYGNAAVSLQLRIGATDIVPWVEYNLNIILYSQSRKHWPPEVCGGYFPSFGEPITFSIWKKLRN